MRTALEMTKFVLVHERGYTENPEELDRLVKARLEHMHKKREDLIREGKTRIWSSSAVFLNLH